MNPIVWTDPAIDDLQGIADYIGRNSEVYAQDVVRGIIASVDRLAAFPESGRRVPEARDPRIREVIHGNYRVIPWKKRDTIEVLAVVHGARSISRMRPRPWNRQ
jgi:plasmid stabilization system protein ParE